MNGNQVPSFGHDDTTMLLVNFLHLVKPVAGSRRLVDVELSAFYIRVYDSNSAISKVYVIVLRVHYPGSARLLISKDLI